MPFVVLRNIFVRNNTNAYHYVLFFVINIDMFSMNPLRRRKSRNENQNLKNEIEIL